MSQNDRQWELDAMRGLMLVLMTLTHLPTKLADPLGQPLGYVSAAEGFVLLSACRAGPDHTPTHFPRWMVCAALALAASDPDWSGICRAGSRWRRWARRPCRCSAPRTPPDPGRWIC